MYTKILIDIGAYHQQSVGVKAIKALLYDDMFIFTLGAIVALLFALIAVAVVVRQGRK